jgi:hypothetical protein
MNMHEENARVIPEEMIVQSGNLNAVLKERRHDLVYFAFGEYEITHDNVLTAITFLHCKPSPESEWSWDSISGNLHVQIIPRNVYFQHIRFIVALFADNF